MLRFGAALATVLLLAGCSAAPAAPTASATPPSNVGSSAASPSASPTDTPVPMPSVTMQVVEVSLKDGKATPNGDRLTVAKGTLLQLRITSDHDDEIHVHGYDVEIAVKSGATVKEAIFLDQVGRFEIESHEPPLTIIQLVVS